MGTWQVALDCLEEIVFFAPDVGAQELCELGEQVGRRVRAELCDERFELAVLGGELIDEGARRGGKEKLLFEFEVVDEFDFVTVDDALSELLDGGGSGICGEGTVS